MIAPGRDDVTMTATRDLLRTRMACRVSAGDRFFRDNASAIAACAGEMADRFFGGATLLVFGAGLHATDAQHNAVEFVHPALPGCRALPAIALSADPGPTTALLTGPDPGGVFAHQVAALARPGDIALALAGSPIPEAVTRGLREARERGVLTIALLTGDPAGGLAADHRFIAPAGDDIVAHELHLATYHMLWELVHIVLNHRGIAAEAVP
jgi:D-sedoheptulose 7-phosphate isomerase